jgi:hypothetical protein
VVRCLSQRSGLPVSAQSLNPIPSRRVDTELEGLNRSIGRNDVPARTRKSKLPSLLGGGTVFAIAITRGTRLAGGVLTLSGPELEVQVAQAKLPLTAPDVVGGIQQMTTTSRCEDDDEGRDR